MLYDSGTTSINIGQSREWAIDVYSKLMEMDNNPFSHNNIFVKRKGEKVIGSIIAYDPTRMDYKKSLAEIKKVIGEKSPNYFHEFKKTYSRWFKYSQPKKHGGNCEIIFGIGAVGGITKFSIASILKDFRSTSSWKSKEFVYVDVDYNDSSVIDGYKDAGFTNIRAIDGSYNKCIVVRMYKKC